MYINVAQRRDTNVQYKKKRVISHRAEIYLFPPRICVFTRVFVKVYDFFPEYVVPQVRSTCESLLVLILFARATYVHAGALRNMDIYEHIVTKRTFIIQVKYVGSDLDISHLNTHLSE